MLGLSGFRNDPVDKFNNRLVDIVRHINRFNHLIFRYFIRAGFNHNNLLRGRSYGKHQIPVVPLGLGRVNNKLAVFHAHLRHRARAVKRNIRNTGRNCRAEHRHKLRAALRIHAHNHII